jgi:hypothetical protein
MLHTTCYRVHANVLRDDAPPGLWEDTAAKLLLLASAQIERMHQERLVLDRRIHNQRVALRKTWEIVENRPKWLGSDTARRMYCDLLKRYRIAIGRDPMTGAKST